MQTQATIKAYVKKLNPKRNAKVTKRVREVFEELLDSGTKCPELWLYRKDETALNVFIGITMDTTGRTSFKQKVEFALSGYKWKCCKVCNAELKTPRRETSTCAGACARSYTNGGVIPKSELKEAIDKFGHNAKLTTAEISKLSSFHEERFDLKPARKTVRSYCEVLDEKLITYEGKTYSERVARALFGASQECRCGKALKFNHATGKFQKSCSIECAASDPDRLRAIKETTLARHGAIGFSLPKTKATFARKYNGNPLLDNKIKTKALDTLERNYGVRNPSQSKDIKAKKVKNSMARYGVRSPNQTIESVARSLRSAFKRKEYKLGRRVIEVQGYEPQALDYMKAAGVKAANICTVYEKSVPAIRYNKGKGRGCVYFPDFYLKHSNTIVEVKSTYTIATSPKQWKLNKRKFKAVTEEGYRFVLLVMESNGSRVLLPNNWMDLTYKQIKKELKVATRRQP